MFVKRFFEPSIAQASYMIGCQANGEAIVIDANRDIDQYVQAAAQEGLRLTHVTETHIHADYVSGSRALARATGAHVMTVTSLVLRYDPEPVFAELAAWFNGFA